MGKPIDYVRKKFAPLQGKTLQNALAHRIATEFPRIGGPRIRQLCADMILEVVSSHLRCREHVRHGNVLWMAVSVNEPPRHRQPIAECTLIPVVLEISNHDDVQMRLDRKSKEERLKCKVIRLCEQAYQQGGLLSNCDLAELLNTCDQRIAQVLTEHERKTQTVVPRRATLHDVGTGVTHKRIICRKRFLEGKEPHVIAQETYHCLEAVDRYLAQYDRVRHCRLQGMTPEETAHTLNCSLGLVHDYLAIDKELAGATDA
jgi:hypothetical protein